jgi:hypothetical protein
MIPSTSREVVSRRTGAPAAKFAAQAVTTLIGAAVLVCAAIATRPFLDRHFTPSFLLSREWYVRLETIVRFALALIGVLLVTIVRSRAGRLAVRAPGTAFGVVIATTLAIAISEPTLRLLHLRPTEWLLPDEEPLRRPDARLGWTLVPGRVGHSRIGGREIEYAIDAYGARVRSLDSAVDPERQSIVFTGESVMFGEGLTWEESVPARVAMLLGVQSANLAVHGYGSDQAHLRLEAELPRFRRPVAVVSMFMTALFGRNLDEDRPHLGPGLQWQPKVERWRLNSLARLLVPYHSSPTIDRGVAVTREVLRATAALARTRSAVPLVVVPQIGPESDPESVLRHRILDGTGVPYVFVELDPDWHLPWDRHPDARGARAIADAIASRLRAQLP